MSGIQRLFELVNVVLTSGIVIFSFALLLHLLIYNRLNNVARTFAMLLGCVLVTYLVDLALFGIEDWRAAQPWLEVQWIGIAFTPAAYLNFSNALLNTTGERNRRQAVATQLSYVLGALLLLGVAFSDLIVRGGALTHGAAHLLAGPLFPLFTLYFSIAVGWGAANVLRARRRCLTSTSRRRMSYLAATFAAPAAGVFPYLLLTGWPASAPGTLLWLMLILGNIGLGMMLVILAYSVASFGALTPDRVVKHRLVHFLLRGPFVATLVVLVIIVTSQAEGWLGLPSRRIMLFGVVSVILLLQIGIELAKPLIDRALYLQDREEIEWIQQLSGRLLTSTDLHQFLENVLTALCELLRVDTAFVAVVDDGEPHLEVACGDLEPGHSDGLSLEAWQVSLQQMRAERNHGAHIADNGHDPNGERRLTRYGDLFVWNGYWLAPLPATQDEDVVLGVLGVAARSPVPNLTPEEKAGVENLLAQAAAALEDRQLQQGIFSALERIMPEIEDIQRRRGMIHYVGDEALSEFSMVESGEFREWVRDALKHYWGGPKLTTNPLMALQVVERAIREQDGNAMRGLRSVLREAVERLRPEGERKMTAPAWLLYNILDLKFLQGLKVREVAQRLAMSESNLYRKQRIAIKAAAQTLAEMEREEWRNQEEGGDEE
ncbi:MAG: histidine kinase N-terminal 7TM domain-containing protein [Anaerolineae bacterium]